MQIISQNADFRAAVTDAWQRLPAGVRIQLDRACVIEDGVLDCWGKAIDYDIRLLPMHRYRDATHLAAVCLHETAHVWLGHSDRSFKAFQDGRDLAAVRAQHEQEADAWMRRWGLGSLLYAIGR